MSGRRAARAATHLPRRSAATAVFRSATTCPRPPGPDCLWSHFWGCAAQRAASPLSVSALRRPRSVANGITSARPAASSRPLARQSALRCPARAGRGSALCAASHLSFALQQRDQRRPDPGRPEERPHTRRGRSQHQRGSHPSRRASSPTCHPRQGPAAPRASHRSWN